MWTKKKEIFFFVLGDELRVKFWKDRLCGDSPLNIALPLLFAFARAKGACGGMFGVWSKVGDVGTLLLSLYSMIGRWRMLRDFCFT